LFTFPEFHICVLLNASTIAWPMWFISFASS
jgi:hypothetical protein